MKKITLNILLLASLVVACNPYGSQDTIYIAISKSSPVEYYGNYSRWIHSVDSTVICLDMYHTNLDSALMLLDGCSGLLLSGGPDVFPGRYDMEGDSLRCGIIDFKRDTLEAALIKAALEKNMPVLGICRGEQLLNVYFGGSLIIDIPTDFDSTIRHRCEDYLNCFHDVKVEKSSLLYEITGALTENVTTNHHQAVKVLAPDLRANAYAGDGLIEGIELAELTNMPFLMAVQWHPERMEMENPLSGPLVREFLRQCR